MSEAACALSTPVCSLLELFSWIVKIWKELPHTCVFLTHDQSLLWLRALTSIASYLNNKDASSVWNCRLEVAVFSEQLIEVVFEIAFEGCLRQDINPLEYASTFSTIALVRLQHHDPDIFLTFSQSTSFLNVLEYFTEDGTKERVHRSDSAIISFKALALAICDAIETTTSIEFIEVYDRLRMVLSALV